MPVKYRINYANHFNQQCRVDIAKADYFGEPIILRSVEGSACTKSYNCEDENAPIVDSNATTTILAESLSQIDILELQTAQDRDFTYTHYIENLTDWTGFVIPDGIQRLFKSEPFDLIITATDGLKLLETIDYVNYTEFEGGINDRTILNYIRKILFFSLNLNLPLPIRWVNTLKNEAFPLEDDVFMGSVRWSQYSEGYTDYQGVNKSCLYILEGMLKSMRCRIFQANGVWNIQRVNDIATGIYDYREIPATLTGNPTPTVVSQNVLKSITSVSLGGDYSFVEEDAIITVRPPLKAVKAIYNQDQRENILPNGNMDFVSLITNEPLFWELTLGGTIESVPSIYDSVGNAVKVTSTNASGKYFQLIDTLPIDSETLYSTINLGFKFSPISGFPVDGDAFILWDTQTFLLVVSYYDNNGDIWYLNEFGFWTKDFVAMIPIEVDNLKLEDVAQIDFNKFQNVPLRFPVNPITNENPPSLKVGFFIPTECEIIFEDIYLNVQQNNDVYEHTLTSSNATAKIETTINISTSHNGFYVSNFMTGYANAGDEMYFSDALFTGTLTSLLANSILRSRYLASLEFNGSVYGIGWNYGECYEIVTLDEKKFIPLNATYNCETCTANLQLLEIRNDAIEAEIKHYGTNDKPLLSN